MLTIGTCVMQSILALVIIVKSAKILYFVFVFHCMKYVFLLNVSKVLWQLRERLLRRQTDFVSGTYLYNLPEKHNPLFNRLQSRNYIFMGQLILTSNTSILTLKN